jgi:hypothetical protein
MRAATLIVIGLFCALASRADDFSQADLHPYLRIHAWRTYVDLQSQVNFDDQDYAITQGGALQAAEARRQGDRSPVNVFIRGVGATAQLNSLKRTLNQNRIGTQTSCELDTQGAQSGPYEITWYGKGSRRNSFVVEFGTAGSSGLPPCGPGVEAMIRAIDIFLNHVSTRPGTQTLTSR